MKKTLLTALCLLASATLWAGDQYLCIWQQNGQVVNIALDDEPVTQLIDGQLVIETNSTVISYPLERVKRYTFMGDFDGIAATEDGAMRVSFDGETIVFSKFNNDTEIRIYNLSGALVRSQHAKAGTGTMVSLKDMPDGAYVVNVDGVTYKLMKR